MNSLNIRKGIGTPDPTRVVEKLPGDNQLKSPSLAPLLLSYFMSIAICLFSPRGDGIRIDGMIPQRAPRLSDGLCSIK